MVRIKEHKPVVKNILMLEFASSWQCSNIKLKPARIIFYHFLNDIFHFLNKMISTYMFIFYHFLNKTFL